MPRIGVLGGSFDPVHLAHLVVAERVREALALDRVLLIPVGLHPLKREAPLAPAADRLEMLRLAARDNPALEVSALELEREGKSYTVDTLLELRRGDPAAELFLILGADAYATLDRWHRVDEIRRVARLVIVPRGPAAAPVGEGPGAPEGGRQIPAREKPLTVDVPRLEISASEIRARVARSQSVRYLTPEAVRAYILSRGLYRSINRSDF
jgi:nicotinate-nucleotide adenylyltransferase